MRQRYYLGRTQDAREIFQSSETPTKTSHPKYMAVVGPFRTKRAAEFMVWRPELCSTVQEAEKKARDFHMRLRYPSTYQSRA